MTIDNMSMARINKIIASLEDQTYQPNPVRYLGYDIRVVRDKATKRDKNGALKRPWYRIAENVGVLSKFYYMMRYSMLKTYAGKYRANVSKIKKKYMRGGVFRVPYDTKSGPKLCEFYHDGFRKHDEEYDNVQDTLPRYIRYDGRNTLANRLKDGICELCGNKTDDIRMRHVRALKKLTGQTEAERLMLHMRRKSLALRPYCYMSTLTQKP